LECPEVVCHDLAYGDYSGAAAMFWGVLGLRGFRRRIWPVGTLVILVMALLIQAVRAWLKVKDGNEAFKLVAAILTLLCAFGVGQLVNFLKEDQRDEFKK